MLRLMPATIPMLYVAAVLMLPVQAMAQVPEVGRAEVDGREVILFENGVWRFAVDDTPVGPECAGMVRLSSQKVPLNYCLSEAEWNSDQAGGTFEAVYTHKQAEVYLGVITEKLTATDAMLRRAIEENARRASGLQPVNVLEDDTDLSINGTDWNFVKLSTKIEGVDFVYWNYYKTYDGNAVQFLFWAGKEHEEEGGKIAQKVANTLRIPN